MDVLGTALYCSNNFLPLFPPNPPFLRLFQDILPVNLKCPANIPHSLFPLKSDSAMTIRQDLAQIIADDNGDADAKARLIIGYLYAVDFFSPGNGFLDDDPEMTPEDEDDESGLDRAFVAAAKYHGLPVG